MKLTNILKEIIVRGNNLFPPGMAENIDLAFTGFGESNSGFDLYDPLSESRDKYNYGEDSGPNGEWEPYDDEEDYPEYKAFNDLLKNSKKVYVGPDIFGLERCPGAPGNALYTRLEIDHNNESFGKPLPDLVLSTPYVGNNSITYVGWFDSTGKYYADTTHFDEDGERIA
jgi:hypothetical protein